MKASLLRTRHLILKEFWGKYWIRCMYCKTDEYEEHPRILCNRCHEKVIVHYYDKRDGTIWQMVLSQ